MIATITKKLRTADLSPGGAKGEVCVIESLKSYIVFLVKVTFFKKVF